MNETLNYDEWETELRMNVTDAFFGTTNDTISFIWMNDIVVLIETAVKVK
jgi:hypothetical protein